MAAPRCARPLFASARRAQLSAPRPSTQPFLRTNASSAGPNTPAHDANSVRAARREEYIADVESGRVGLEERLEDLGIDAAQYKELHKAQQKALQAQDKWMPKTREEAERKWKRLQDSPDHNILLEMYRREGVEVLKLAKERGITLPTDKPPLPAADLSALNALRTPLNVQAIHLRPLRREPTLGVPVCDLQLRTYSIRNLLLFADFAVRAAYYMGLCARGPIPLPRITERWTVPRANFIFKKSQENFERITLRRLIQIQDGHPDVVKAWLAFLLKHQYHGVGMKANIWEFEGLEEATRAGYKVEEGDYSRRREGPMLEKVEEILKRKGFREAMKGYESPVELRP